MKRMFGFLAAEKAGAAARVCRSARRVRDRLGIDAVDCINERLVMENGLPLVLYVPVIRSFRDSEAEELFHREASRRWAAIARVALRRLRLLHRARTLDDLRV